jgi:phosphoglycolate phosphatase
MLPPTPIRLAVFDCDGTLVDSQHNIIAAMTAAFREHGLADPTPAAVRGVVGLHLADAIASLLPAAQADVAPAVCQAYIDAFRALRKRHDHEEPLYPGVVRTLDALERAGAVLAIATGKGRRGLETTLDRHGLRNRFVVLKTADDGPGKPDPKILLDAIAETGSEPGHTAMIGDTVYDVKMARSARVYAVGVAWGYHPPCDLHAAGAHHVVDNFGELPDLLEGFWRTELCASEQRC